MGTTREAVGNGNAERRRVERARLANGQNRASTLVWRPAQDRPLAGNDQALRKFDVARPETPPVVEDAAAVQRRAEMEERMAAPSSRSPAAGMRARRRGGTVGVSRLGAADGCRRVGRRAGAGRRSADAPPVLPPPPLEKIVDAFAAKQATWREHLKAQHLTSLATAARRAAGARDGADSTAR